MAVFGSRLTWFLKTLFTCVSIATVIFVTVLYFAQEKMAFMNTGKNPLMVIPKNVSLTAWTPDQLGITYRNVTVLSPETSAKKSNMLKLHGWFAYHEGMTHDIPTIVYFHENDYYPPARLLTIQQLYEGTKKFNVLMVDYRGYGLSEGHPSEEATKLDVKAIMDYVFATEEIDDEKVIIFGASLGGVMANYAGLHYQDRLRGIILQNTGSSAISLVESKLWIIKPLLPYINSLSFPSIERIAHLTLPIMFIVSIEDPLTPAAEMHKLYEGATLSVYKKMYEINSADHYFPYLTEEGRYQEMITNFIDSCSEPAMFKKHIQKLEDILAKKHADSLRIKDDL